MSRQELSLYWSVFVIENSWRTSALIRQIAHINNREIFIFTIVLFWYLAFYFIKANEKIRSLLLLKMKKLYPLYVTLIVIYNKKSQSLDDLEMK